MKGHLLQRVGGIVLAGTLALAFVSSARASIVERVVAVVGERPILLTDLLRRRLPFYVRILASTSDASQRAAYESEMNREVLNRMIDDRLEEQAADKAHLGVTPEEVDNALRNIAGAAKISVRDLLTEAKRQGLSEQDYRDELRRQVLEGKLVQLRVRGRVRVTEEDARAAYTHWLKESGQETVADVRIIAKRIPPGSPPEVVKAREALAQNIAEQARQGKDFCKLVKEYSEDTPTIDTCGSRGPLPLSGLVPPLREAASTMKAGEVSNPIRYAASPQDEVLLIVQSVTPARVPTYSEMKDQMAERAFGEAMERQRKLWLQELRRGIYIDVRL